MTWPVNKAKYKGETKRKKEVFEQREKVQQLFLPSPVLLDRPISPIYIGRRSKKVLKQHYLLKTNKDSTEIVIFSSRSQQ
jgi:hypothetical protein